LISILKYGLKGKPRGEKRENEGIWRETKSIETRIRYLRKQLRMHMEVIYSSTAAEYL
jgi:hypothetical protein